MQSKSTNSNRGFSLLELLVALSLGLLVVGASVQLFSKALDATWMVSQRAELQQDARAASNLLAKDISMAGAGLQTGGIALVSGTATRPRYGCDYSGTCYLNGTNSILFPCAAPAPAACVPYLFGVIPGFRQGITIAPSPTATDVITVAYLDTQFLLSDYQVKFNDLNGNSTTFTLPSPAPNPLDQAVNNIAVGLQRGDLVLFSSNSKGLAVAEVTAAVPAGGGPSYTVAFATADTLQLNQNAGAAGDLKQVVSNVGGTAPGTTASRLWVITYYLDNTTGVPRLMRQVNARIPVPVTENVVDLRFTYDTYDSSGNLLNATGDGGQSLGISPNLIRNINIWHLTVRSQLRGANGYQSIDMQNSISARNLSFQQRYQ